ncbi:MAG: hypothetical protein JNK02_10435 [Planctomycetes bacterium]|nr:hypothetical protein [Planctomycetota bacterium]
MLAPDWAGGMLARIRTVAAYLRDAGVAVEMQAVANPGLVGYEEEHQVAVVPWQDRQAL